MLSMYMKEVCIDSCLRHIQYVCVCTCICKKIIYIYSIGTNVTRQDHHEYELTKMLKYFCLPYKAMLPFLHIWLVSFVGVSSTLIIPETLLHT